ncbi:hypothetical protein [Massilia orientalis]|uniref:Uncharacterized protein n=1 Tax=Massilia orientalis TaxID=3050128 RepID=A0ACC7M774_9BURK|nr:hypothetical protein [Massilia sp. YIM B02787]
MHETKVNTNHCGATPSEAKKASPRPYWYRPEVGPQPPFALVSTNIGLGGGRLYALVLAPDGYRYECGIQDILRVIDLIQEPGRTKLLAGAEIEYGLLAGAMMGPVIHLPHDTRASKEGRA